MGRSNPIRKVDQERQREILRENRESREREKSSSHSKYELFGQINGYHPYKEKVPGGYVEYLAGKREGGKVAFFNFDLAKEMGLIESDHPEIITKELENVVLDTFSLMIINEYDILHETKNLKKEIKPNLYMCTRYLQLQHPNKKGKTSGDGRSLWNGIFKGKGKIWDITSCGTGATCLSPASAKKNRFFKTGDPHVSYGCGLSDFLDGLSAGILSEVFHKNNIKTERTLALIEYKRGQSVNVRVGTNLIRPGHFFHFLKQNNYEGLKNAIDYYIEREVINGELPQINDEVMKYSSFLERITQIFAEMAAIFEREYIFCWLDWDGDNILANGGIIDYGSVRQFGLFHSSYRYDDVERMSTNLLEQRSKAKYIVQTFIQAIDYLVHNKKQKISSFSKHPLLRRFDLYFEKKQDEILLKKMGFNQHHVEYLMKEHLSEIQGLFKTYSFFERAKSSKGMIKVADGINQNALFSMRNLLFQLPFSFLQNNAILPPDEFLKLMETRYFIKEGGWKLSSRRIKIINQFQQQYLKLVTLVAKDFSLPEKRILLEMRMRSSLINKTDRITGDAVIYLAQKLNRERKKLNTKDFHHLFAELVSHQIFGPQKREKNFQNKSGTMKDKDKMILDSLLKIIKMNREGL